MYFSLSYTLWPIKVVVYLGFLICASCIGFDSLNSFTSCSPLETPEHHTPLDPRWLFTWPSSKHCTTSALTPGCSVLMCWIQKKKKMASILGSSFHQELKFIGFQAWASGGIVYNNPCFSLISLSMVSVTGGHLGSKNIK